MTDHRTYGPQSQHHALDRREAEQAATEPYRRPAKAPSVTVGVGRHRWVIPTASIVGAVLAGLGAAWGVVERERSAIRQADADLAARIEAQVEQARKAAAAQDARIEAQAEQVRACAARLATQDVLLAEIKTQLQRIDARVAEVQLTLMRSRP